MNKTITRIVLTIILIPVAIVIAGFLFGLVGYLMDMGFEFAAQILL